MKSPLLVAAALVLGASLHGSGSAACLMNSLDRGFCGPETSDAPAKNWDCGDGYDLVAGTLRSTGGGPGEGGGGVNHQVQDQYWIVGPGTSVALPFRVRLHTTGVCQGGFRTLPFIGLVCSSSQATMRLASGAVFSQVTVSSQGGAACGPTTIDETQEIALQHIPGEVFVVQVQNHLSASALITSNTHGQLSFDGLPAGYTIQSCQGFAGPVVPAAARSWGSLKHSYR